MSVIEHGVDTMSFLREAYRVLRIGGRLVLSTDFWYRPVERAGSLFGRPDSVFSLPEIAKFLYSAARLGFSVPDCPDPPKELPPPSISFGGIEYTFLFMVLRKESDTVA
jgi:SAM-dependent methyltransferase